MRINSSYSSQVMVITGDAKKSTPSEGKVDFSNISSEDVESINKELLVSGKITLRQSVELTIMDGAIFQYQNGGMPKENMNLYTAIENEIEYQKKNGIGDIQATVESYKKLEDILKSFEEISNQSKSSGVNV